MHKLSKFIVRKADNTLFICRVQQFIMLNDYRSQSYGISSYFHGLKHGIELTFHGGGMFQETIYQFW